MITFSSFAFGCRVNEAEKEALDKKMLEAGFSLIKRVQIFLSSTLVPSLTKLKER